MTIGPPLNISSRRPNFKFGLYLQALKELTLKNLILLTMLSLDLFYSGGSDTIKSITTEKISITAPIILQEIMGSMSFVN